MITYEITVNEGKDLMLIKLIDAIKKESNPFGGGSEKLQTGKGYADEKPTNDSVRVKSPELDKFVQEDVTIPTKITTKEELSAYVEKLKAQGNYKGIPKESVPLLAGQVLYDVAVRMADKMLQLWQGLGKHIQTKTAAIFQTAG